MSHNICRPAEHLRPESGGVAMQARRAAVAVITAAMIAACGGSETTTTTPSSGPSSVAGPAPTSTEVPVTHGTTAPVTTTADVSVAEPTAEELAFQSDDFELAGTLRLPAGTGPFPAVIVVHGSGPQTRASTFGLSQMQRFTDGGFAVYSWDKPGSGASTGAFDDEQTLRQRAAILAAGFAAIADHPAIDPARIGLWGLSQAGWVMPLALDLVDTAAFMIVVSGGAEDSIEQMAYRVSELLICQGLSREEGELVERYGPQAAKGPTYALYAEAMEVLLAIPETEPFVGSEIADEEEWQPWPPEIDAYFDPMDVIQHTTIPVLAVFGEMDKNVDPVQGAAAYEQALGAAGNGNYHVEIIPGTGHTMQSQQTGCPGEPAGVTAKRYLELLEEWIAMLAETL